MTVNTIQISTVLVPMAGVSNYFSKLNYGASQLDAVRKDLKIMQGIKTSSETQFSTSHIQLKAVQMPAIHKCIETSTVKFTTESTKKLLPLVSDTPERYPFMSKLPTFIMLSTAPANAILTLEGKSSTVWKSFMHEFAWHGLLGASLKRWPTFRPTKPMLLASIMHEYHQYGALKLAMPDVQDWPLSKDKYPTLFWILLTSALNILKGKQECTGKFGNASASTLIAQLMAWAYNREPFQSTVWTSKMNTLDSWKAVSKDSNVHLYDYYMYRYTNNTPTFSCPHVFVHVPDAPKASNNTPTIRSPAVVHSTDRFDILEYVKLDNPGLAQLIEAHGKVPGTDEAMVVNNDNALFLLFYSVKNALQKHPWVTLSLKSDTYYQQGQGSTKVKKEHKKETKRESKKDVKKDNYEQPYSRPKEVKPKKEIVAVEKFAITRRLKREYGSLSALLEFVLIKVLNTIPWKRRYGLVKSNQYQTRLAGQAPDQ
ncbi:hypothetical protein DFH07DRAFT_771050 [Mycena maculata]|uniref:Uncharacterized protein n=1 Tax=Mycena maculata TaxID=230809 RepID=A0AAD7JGI4_9AGAR|nr:hypothetical protein DFH07DRAFT_771050 [Mycena maculata]